MKLLIFCEKVNELAQAEAEKLNANPNKLFGAVHHPFSPSMLDYYYLRNFTPQQTLKAINSDAGI